LNDAEGFFKAYLALPVVMFMWLVGYFWKRTGWLKLSQIDVDNGRRAVNWDRINGEKQRIAAMPAWRRLIHMLF
jgi:amino acid transporter